MIQFPNQTQPQQQQLPASNVDTKPTTFKEISVKENEHLIGIRRNLTSSVFNNRMREIDWFTVEKLRTEANTEAYHFMYINKSSYVFFHNNLWYSYIKNYGTKVEGMFTAETPEDLMLGMNRKFERRPYRSA